MLFAKDLCVFYPFRLAFSASTEAGDIATAVSPRQWKIRHAASSRGGHGALKLERSLYRR